MDYSTYTERAIKELREVAGQEKYAEAIEGQLKAMEESLAREKADDLTKHRAEVGEMLKAELLTRYYYDRGRIEGALKSDPVVKRALGEL